MKRQLGRLDVDAGNFFESAGEAFDLMAGKTNNTGDGGVEGVVSTAADIAAFAIAAAALANNNLASLDSFATINFDAQSFGM